MLKLNDPDLGIKNPMWDELRPHVGYNPMPFSGGGLIVGGTQEPPRARSLGEMLTSSRMMSIESRVQEVLDGADWLHRRWEYVNKYSWTVTDPWSVQLVHQWAGGRLIDPMAGTGYWGYLLDQLGVDVALFDANPPTATASDNIWHPRNEQWLTVNQMDGVEAVERYGFDRTLLLSWPPQSDAGGRILRAYTGDMFIWMGEFGTSCGDEGLMAEIARNWQELHSAVPVRFLDWLHDDLRVYRRAGTDALLGGRESEQEHNLRE